MRTKKRQVYSRILRLTGVLLFIAMLTGCALQSKSPAELPASSATPPPVSSQGDSKLSVQLFFPTADGRSLSSETREVAWPQNTSRALCALKALCDGPESDQLKRAIPEGWSMANVELSGDVCEAYFTGSAASDTDVLIARAAVAATVNANEGIANTDLFLNGMQPGWEGKPLGVIKPLDETLEAYLREYAPQTNTGEAESFDRLGVQLFFSDDTGKLLLCDVRDLSYKSQAQGDIIIEALLGELSKGPVESNGREPVLPSDMQLKKCVLPQTASESSLAPPLASGAPDGALVELYFTRPAASYNEQIAFASIVYSVTSFWPGIGGVRIYLDDTPVMVDDVLHNGAQGSVFLRSDFAGTVGHTATLLFPDQDGVGLYPVLRCLPQGEAYDPLARLRALFTGPADPGMPLSMFTADDVLSVSVQGDTAVVNWKEGFYQKLSAFMTSKDTLLPQNTRAQMVVFAIVDTLSGIPGVQRVWLLEDGHRIDKSVNLLYLGNALFYNPGLLLTDEGASS